MNDRPQNGDGIRFLVYAILFCFTYICLFLNAATLEVEYFDGIDFLNSGLGLNGAPWGVLNPKNIQQIFFPAIVFRGAALFGLQPGLRFFHILYFFAHAALPLLTAAILRGDRIRLSFFFVACLAAWNRIFVHYSPFLFSDLSCGAWVALWLYLELKVPIHQRSRFWLQMLALTLIATNRPHAVLIPLFTSLGVLCGDRKRLKYYLGVAVGGLALYSLIFFCFYSLVNHAFELASVAKGIRYLRNYGGSLVFAGHYPSPTLYFSFLFLGLTPLGFALLTGGLFVLAFHWKELPRSVRGFFLGSLLYLAFLCKVGEKQARYLGPVLPAIAILQIYAVDALERRRRWVGFAVGLLLFESVLPEFLHFTDPFYRAPLFADTAKRIAAWSESKYAIELPFYAAFHPRQFQFHEDDQYFYIYHWGPQAMNFFTGMPVILHFSATFYKYGYPIPDDLEKWAPPGATVILPSPVEIFARNATNFIYPIYALRWHTNQERSARNCDLRVLPFCVEILRAFPDLP